MSRHFHSELLEKLSVSVTEVTASQMEKKE